MDRNEALKIVRENYPHFGTTEPWLDLEKALATLIPELRKEPEPELSEYAEEARVCITEHLTVKLAGGLSSTVFIDNTTAKVMWAKLLDIAKTQLLQSGELLTQEHHQKLMDTLAEQYKSDLGSAYKGIPKWRKAKKDIRCTDIDYAILWTETGGDHPYDFIGLANEIREGDWHIELADLENLPKEED